MKDKADSGKPLFTSSPSKQILQAILASFQFALSTSEAWAELCLNAQSGFLLINFWNLFYIKLRTKQS